MQWISRMTILNSNHRSGECQARDRRRPGLNQRFRALLHGRSGRHNIIDQHDMTIRNRFPVPDPKCILHILLSLSGRKQGLGLRVLLSDQYACIDWNCYHFSNTAGENLALIVPSFSPAHGMKRNRHDHVSG